MADPILRGVGKDRTRRYDKVRTSGESPCHNLTCPLCSAEIKCKLMDLLFRFGVTGLCDVYENSLLTCISCNLSHVPNAFGDEAFAVSRTDSHEITDAYITGSSNNSELLTFSLFLFDWASSRLDQRREDLVLAFYKTSYERLWVTLDLAQEEYTQTVTAVGYAYRVIEANAYVVDMLA
jgi:hypothetical protein